MDNLEIENGMMNKDQSDANSSNYGEGANDSSNQSRYYKKNNRKTAAKRNAKLRKEEKRDRLIRERDSKKADLKRGYKIIKTKDKKSKKKEDHIQINSTERSFVEAAVVQLEDQIFDLNTEIEKLEEEIKNMAKNKTTILQSRLKGKKKDKRLSIAIKSAKNFFSKESENGKKELTDDIKYKMEQKKENEAYNSLMDFLRSDSSPVKKRFLKDPVLENQVLEQLISNLEKGQL